MVELITNIFQTTVIYSTPILLAAIGGLYSERSGVVNIALEGFMTIGAFTAAVVTLYTHNPWIGLGVASLMGMVFALIHAISTITYHADQVVSGMAINFLALGFSMYLVKWIYHEGQTPVVENKLNAINIPGLAEIPIIGPGIFQAYPTTYLAILFVVITFLVFKYTSFGMRIRAVGEHPQAVQAAGVSVMGVRYICVLLSGALAGLGGAGLSISIGSEFNATTVAGQGFIALAALIFGKWRPIGVLTAATFFGFAVALSLIGQLLGLTKYVASEWINMLPYLLTIFTLAGVVGGTKSPSALGKPFRNIS